MHATSKRIIELAKNVYACWAPRWLAAQIAKRREHLRIIEWTGIRKLRAAKLTDLRNREFLESLLPQLGLVNSRTLVPAAMHQWIGTGLWHWQHPRQFAPCLIKLSELPVHSYLEIGVKYGGTFVITVEFLARFTEIRRAVGVDANFCPSLVRYARENPRVKFVQLNTRDPRFARLVEEAGGFDLVLIDGDHEEEGCRKDFEIVYPQANVIVFHDIVNESTPGPGAVWRELRQKYHTEFDFYECTEQYPEVVALLGKTVLGLGMAVRKRWLALSG